MLDEQECAICDGSADEMFKRMEIWSDDRWRLTASRYHGVYGFCYLEPKRHIPYLTDLDGQEAREFGPVLAGFSAAIKQATGSKLVYVYIYGDHIPHLHVHLAPHVDGDAYSDDVIKSNVEIDSTTLSDEQKMTNLSRKIREYVGENGKTDLRIQGTRKCFSAHSP